ncbi:MAG TPA: hypothetical protein VIA81_03235 [Acidimicrobiia bacterium]
MNEVEIALAVSAREWPDRLHRFLSDHGGARVRAQVLTAEDSLAEEFQVLVIDDVCSFLTPRLVQEIQSQGRLVLGVFDPAEFPEGKERLRECGVDHVIESDATADEFVVALRALVALVPAAPPVRFERHERAPANSTLIVIGGPPGGCGATEVAITWAVRLARIGRTLLVDLDEFAPAVAQRLGLSLLPNIRSAIDIVQHRHGKLEDCLQPVSRLEVLAGMSSDRDWTDVRPYEITQVIGELRRRYRYVVANVGSMPEPAAVGASERGAISATSLEQADRIVAVGTASPVGLSRLIAWSERASDIASRPPDLLLVNRAPASRFKRAEILEELGRSQSSPIGFLPSDRQVEMSAWDGVPATSGRFWRSISRFVDRTKER